MFEYVVRASVVGENSSYSYKTMAKTPGHALHRIRRMLDKTARRVSTISVSSYQPIAR